MSKEKDYYTLSQFHSKSGVCYVPVDSDKVIMRLALSKDEAYSRRIRGAMCSVLGIAQLVLMISMLNFIALHHLQMIA